MIVVTFGLPGAGKTYVGKVFQDHFGFYFYDGDTDLTSEMHDAIQNKQPISDEMRDLFFDKLIESSFTLKAKYKKLVVSQTFIKEKYRKKLLKKIPEVRFVLVQTPTKIREERLSKRKDYPLDLEYTRIMCSKFDAPQINYSSIDNTIQGEDIILKQIKQIFPSLTHQ